MSDIRLLSLNTFGGMANFCNIYTRYKAISAILENSNVDVIHLQEVFTYVHLVIFKSFLKSFSYCEYTKSVFGPKGGLVIFSKYPLKDTKYIKYERKFVPYFSRSWVEIFTQRGALITTINSKNIILINTHLTAVLNWDWGKNSRYYRELNSEIDQIHSLLNQLDLALLSGDFNIARDSDLFNRLIDHPKLEDLFKVLPLPTIHKKLLKKNKNPIAIDYIFAIGDRKKYIIKNLKQKFDKEFKIGKKQIYLSDHKGLFINLNTL